MGTGDVPGKRSVVYGRPVPLNPQHWGYCGTWEIHQPNWLHDAQPFSAPPVTEPLPQKELQVFRVHPGEWGRQRENESLVPMRLRKVARGLLVLEWQRWDGI